MSSSDSHKRDETALTETHGSLLPAIQVRCAVGCAETEYVIKKLSSRFQVR